MTTTDLTTPTPTDPWLRRPADTDKSWEAFCIYRDLGHRRMFIRVAEVLHKSGALVYRWAKAHDWKARANAYDAAMDAEVRTRLENRRSAVAERQSLLADAALDKVEEAIGALDAKSMTPGDVAAWARTFAQIQQAAHAAKEEDTGATGTVVVILDAAMIPGPTATSAHMTVDADPDLT